MASLYMDGPFPFSLEQINAIVTKTSAGNYALGDTNDEGVFNVNYVGRSDTDLKKELKARLSNKYKKFK